MEKDSAPLSFRCPVSGAALSEATSECLGRINAMLGKADQALCLPEGTQVSLPLRAAFVPADETFFYPVADGIPVLLPEMRLTLTTPSGLP